MRRQKHDLNQHQTELVIRVTKEEALPQYTRAAAHISEHRPIKGFRPGKAPLEVVKREFGEEAIREEAFENIINDSFAAALQEENLFTYGQPKFELLAPEKDEAVAYKATVTRMPTVKLGKWQEKKIKPAPIDVTEDEVAKALDEVAGMVTSELPEDRPAQMQDKVLVDFEATVDGKVIDGGTAQDFGLVLGEGRMIPGFEEKIVGAKAGEKLEFDLNFPEQYHATTLAGKPAHFLVTLKQVLARIKPAVDDEFAKRLGLADLAALKARLKENILQEKQDKELEKAEIAAIKQLVETAKFSDLPEAMIQDTVQDIVHDFEHTLAHQGLPLDQYLKSINKNLDQLKKEFEPKAVERIKASMALGQLAEDEKITLTQEEIEAELKGQKHPDADKIEFRRHVANQLMNRKLISHLKQKIVE